MKQLRYCCFCGRELVFKTLLDGSRERYCPGCDHVFFDEPSPAVIVAVTRRDKILLTRSVEWKHPYWSLVAGHVKSGETAEEAAVREVKEETGVQIFNLQILGTYAPEHRDLLIIGYGAETDDTGIKRSQELEKADWFSLHDPLPLRPDSTAAKIVAKILERCP